MAEIALSQALLDVAHPGAISLAAGLAHLKSLRPDDLSPLNAPDVLVCMVPLLYLLLDIWILLPLMDWRQSCGPSSRILGFPEPAKLASGSLKYKNPPCYARDSIVQTIATSRLDLFSVCVISSYNGLLRWLLNRLLIMYTLLLSFLTLCTFVLGQTATNQSIPNTFPHAYPGMPTGDFSPAWQKYYEVTSKLPNITGTLPRSFAGNIPVNRENHPNNTLFFWGWERQNKNGSLTAPADVNNTDPWLIWLQGGPGSSGMIGLMTENGPIHVLSNYSLVLNNNSWNTLVDAIWIDQPVGTGYSTSDSTGYIPDEDQMAEDFLGFLANLVKIFPSLATRPLYLTGESYAGTYIPYITKHLFSTPNPPVQLRKIAIGDGSLGSLAVVEELPVLNVIETYPQLINYDQDVFNYFKEQEHLCGLDLVLKYPQNGHFPTLTLIGPTSRSDLSLSLTEPAEARVKSKSWQETIASKYYALHGSDNQLSKRSETLERREEKRAQWKRDLSGRANGSIDPFYGCFLFNELTDYAVNFSFPWSNGNFDVYDIPDGTNPEPPLDASVFLNDNRTRAALHAPTSKNWIRNFNYPFGSVFNRNIGNQYGDPSVEPMAFLSDLAANASIHNVSIIFYSGNDDSLVQHHGTEVIIQNMTFGGIQGFTQKPSTAWFDDQGNFAGIVHQERGLTYILFNGAGHLVPEWKPAQALVFLREFVLGSNLNGTVSGTVIVGGENATLANDYLPGGDVFFFGSGKTQGTSTVPQATQAAWRSFIATATITTAASHPVVTAGATTTSVTLLRVACVVGLAIVSMLLY
ncbi:putative serine carboxypeptidase CPVL [Grifola frondosa]|uniref:Carboxypeptidase n=1 Tax=Grifola frondosa TaxID=5627 RepID=A0A1C7M614_GRIFR|nr:putative serine carboxypeptidase CPVL [Grifola frondosa]